MRCLHGDLNQMYTQMEFLQRHGIAVSVSGGIPQVSSEQYERALRLIWENRIIGWWNYFDSLIKRNICTEDEYKNALC